VKLTKTSDIQSTPKSQPPHHPDTGGQYVSITTQRSVRARQKPKFRLILKKEEEREAQRKEEKKNKQHSDSRVGE